MAATRESVGTASLRTSSRLPLTAGAREDSPVMCPPGRARLATRPSPTGSPLTAMTMGIVVVACWAARSATVPSTTRMSTGSRTSSTTSAGSRSACPSAKRYSRAMVRPSTYPRSRSPCRKASRREATAETELGMSSPSRGTCAADCAWDVSGAASRLRTSVTRTPTALYHIILSSHQPHANLLLSMEAERYLDILQEWAIISWNDISPAFLCDLQSTGGQSVVTNTIPSAFQYRYREHDIYTHLLGPDHPAKLWISKPPW